MNPFHLNQQPFPNPGFQPLPSQPPIPNQPVIPLNGVSTPQSFTVSGPSGYHGWGWTSEMGNNSSYLRYQDNSGGGFSIWRSGNYFRFQ